jgi:thiol-disulfide isomerase/thioredoxin
MRNTILIVILALVGALGGFFAGGWLEEAPQRELPPGLSVLKIGDPRADLNLPDSGGKPRQLAEWNGKLILLNFWATWCGPCREEMPLLDRLHQAHSGRGLEVVGIAMDDPGAVRSYLAQSPVLYPILISNNQLQDPSLLFGDTRGVLPFSVLIGRDGRVLAQRAGGFSERGLEHWLKPHL